MYAEIKYAFPYFMAAGRIAKGSPFLLSINKKGENEQIYLSVFTF